MNAGDFAQAFKPLHSFRVTPLWTACTPLKNKKLEKHKFD
jgi:hypothetical protein